MLNLKQQLSVWKLLKVQFKVGHLQRYQTKVLLLLVEVTVHLEAVENCCQDTNTTVMGHLSFSGIK